MSLKDVQTSYVHQFECRCAVIKSCVKVFQSVEPSCLKVGRISLYSPAWKFRKVLYSSILMSWASILMLCSCFFFFRYMFYIIHMISSWKVTSIIFKLMRTNLKVEHLPVFKSCVKVFEKPCVRFFESLVFDFLISVNAVSTFLTVVRISLKVKCTSLEVLCSTFFLICCEAMSTSIKDMRRFSQTGPHQF